MEIKILLIPLTRPLILDFLDSIKELVEDSFREAGLKTEIMIWTSILKPPMKCFNWGRQQYYSFCVLEWLYNTVSKNTPGYYVAGLGYLDAYEEGLSFVFGEAYPRAKTAIVYTKRLYPPFYGQKTDYNLYVERIAKEIVHEIGHLLGLRHCRNYRCVMSFSNSITDVDRKTRYYCRECKNALNKKLYV